MNDRSLDLIHIHEDDWALRSLHPVAVQREVASDLEASRDASKKTKHRRELAGLIYTSFNNLRQTTPKLGFA